MERHKPLRSDPEKTRAWQNRTRRPLPARSAKRRQADLTLAEARRQVARRAGGYCEARIGGVCTARGVHAHHVRRRAQGGPDVPENLLWLCAACHGWVHTNVAAAVVRGLLATTTGM